MLVTVDCVQVTAQKGGCLIDARLNNYDTKNVSYLLWSSVNFNNEDQPVNVQITVFGTWK